MKEVRKAVIPAAGFGTRFLPATKVLPKEMLPIIDTPTLHYIVEEVVSSGIQDILIIVNRHKNAIADYFDRACELEMLLKRAGKSAELKSVEYSAEMANISFVRQKEMKGSGQAIQLARSFCEGEPFAVLYGDDLIYNPEKPCLKQLVDAYMNTSKTILGVQQVPMEEVSKYGVIRKGAVKGRYSEVLGFVEKPKVEDAPSNLVSMGRYVLTPAIFDALDSIRVEDGKELYMTDAIDVIARTEGVFAYEFEGKRYDIGDKLGYLRATVEFALRDEKLKEPFRNYLKSLLDEENF
ncbi:MAG: UTP--glucose-1-phosphate uridylyltransferase GalU [Christensenellales bacterium]